MTFNAIEYLTPIKEFLQTYPDLQANESLEIDYMAFESATPGETPGLGAIFIAGSNVVQYSQDVIGDALLSVQDNYILLIRRRTGENTLRRNAGDFLRNYVRWINYENAIRNTRYKNPLLPQFSNFTNPQEAFTANGEMWMGTTDDGADEFQVQIQIKYKLFYEGDEY